MRTMKTLLWKPPKARAKHPRLWATPTCHRLHHQGERRSQSAPWTSCHQEILHSAGAATLSPTEQILSVHGSCESPAKQRRVTQWKRQHSLSLSWRGRHRENGWSLLTLNQPLIIQGKTDGWIWMSCHHAASIQDADWLTEAQRENGRKCQDRN